MVIDPSNIRQSNVTLNSGEANKARRENVVKDDVSSNSTVLEPKQQGDSVTLSVTGKSLAQLEANLAGTPEVNHAKVESLRQSINNGTYQIDASKIAEKMLTEDALLNS